MIGDSVTQGFFLCSPEPFVFTYQTRRKEIADAFSRVVRSCVAVRNQKEYGDRLYEP